MNIGAGDQESGQRERERGREVKNKIKKLKKLYGWVIVAANTYRSAATFYTNLPTHTHTHTYILDTFNMSVSFQFTITSYCKHNLLCIFFVSHYSILVHFRTHTCFFETVPFLLLPLTLLLRLLLLFLFIIKHWCNCCSVTEPNRAYTCIYTLDVLLYIDCK